ncbi:helix-turn-helix transcriptional regulator [Streptosporangium sp. KLBMP 9127]|nr:helix-turn-helix transcriptional regulator [Streptosporangium sp. KLBMP 9127]
MHENLGEQITIDDMARTAMFSKFHFSRVFQRVTGLSPGRYLSAVRLREAKRLLASTSLSVTNISHQVGYSSVGTFSSRFAHSVGLPPSKYRQHMSITTQILTVRERPADVPAVSMHGEITSPLGDQPIFAGLFPDQILEGRPVGYTVLSRPGPYVIENVPEGRWHLIAQSMAPGREDAIHYPPGDDEALCIARHGPIVIGRDGGPQRANVQLKPMRPFDPPVLLALRDLLAPGVAH